MENANQNFDLLAMTAEIVNSSMTSKSSRKSMNDFLLEVLLNVKKPMTKKDIVAKIAYLRLLDKNTEDYYKNLDQDKLQKLLAAEIKTTNNGFDTATCNGKTNSSFTFNEAYSKYDLVKHPNKTYEIKLK